MMDMLLPLLVQTTGLIAAILSTGAFLLSGPRRILAVSTLGSVAWFLHFLLSGAFAGAATASGSIVRNGAGAWLDRRQMIWLTWAAAILVFAAGITFDPKGYVVLAVIPLRAIANHLREREMLFRIVCSVSGACYVIYGMQIGSLAVWASALLTTAVVLGAPMIHVITKRKHDIPAQPVP